MIDGIKVRSIPQNAVIRIHYHLYSSKQANLIMVTGEYVFILYPIFGIKLSVIVSLIMHFLFMLLILLNCGLSILFLVVVCEVLHLIQHEKVFAPLDLFHILLCYSLNSKWMKSFIYSHPSTQYPLMTK